LQQQRKQQGPGKAERRAFEHHGDVHEPADQHSNEIDQGIEQGREHATMVRIAACAGKPPSLPVGRGLAYVVHEQ
jgi:hypothetical protein